MKLDVEKMKPVDNLNVGKYIIEVIKGDTVTVIEVFDTEAEAMKFGNQIKAFYPFRKGILHCRYRMSLNLPESEVRKGRTNYRDRDVYTWFDVDEYLEHEKRRRERRKPEQPHIEQNTEEIKTEVFEM